MNENTTPPTKALGDPSFIDTAGGFIESVWVYENEKDVFLIYDRILELGFEEVESIAGTKNGEVATFLRKTDNLGAYINEEDLVIVNLDTTSAGEAF